ncbi:MAG: hypothetical protein OCD76_11235 [Reichenbachiella sp.]
MIIVTQSFELLAMRVSKSFERNILEGICYVGIVRYLIAVYQVMFEKIELSTLNFSIHSGMMVLYLVTLYILSLNKYVDTLRTIWAWVFIATMSFFWLRNNGIQGYSEELVVVMMVVVAMITNGSKLKRFIGLILILQVAMLAALHWDIGGVRSITNSTIGHFPFQLNLLIGSSLLIFMTLRYHKEKQRYYKKKNELHVVLSQLQDENSKLEKKEEELQEVNYKLALRVEVRSNELSANNEALLEYLNISDSEIAPALQELISQIGEYNKIGKGEFRELLIMSGGLLSESFESIENSYKGDV